MIPIKGDGQKWMDTHLINQQLTQSERAIKVDVVFLGDSITEGWRETGLGTRKVRAARSQDVFDSLFSRTKGAKYNGLALGIGGDTVGTHPSSAMVILSVTYVLTLDLVANATMETAKRRASIEPESFSFLAINWYKRYWENMVLTGNDCRRCDTEC